MKITVEFYEPHEMARVKVGGKIVCEGNYWDFHAGCQGTKLLIGKTFVNFKSEWTEEIRRPIAVARMIARHLKQSEDEIEVSYREKQFR